MLPKKNRLRKKKEIDRGYKTRVQFQTQNTKIFLSPNKNDSFKLLVVVSKKISKRAHERNRIRRKIHGIFQRCGYGSNLGEALTCIILVSSKNIIRCSSSKIQEEILPSLRQGVLKIQK